MVSPLQNVSCLLFDVVVSQIKHLSSLTGDLAAAGPSACSSDSNSSSSAPHFNPKVHISFKESFNYQ